MSEADTVFPRATPDRIAADLAPLVDFQDEALPLDVLDQMLQARLVPHLVRYDRPGFQSMFNAFLEPGAALGAHLAVDHNQGVTNWQVSPGAVMLEELCCQALCRLFGLAPTAEATFMLAGTYANQQALYMALHRHAERYGFDLAQEGLAGFRDPTRLAVVTSRDAHFSLKHVVRNMGLGERCLFTVKVDRNRRIDLAHAREVVDKLSSTHDVFCLVATAGTTATGSVDPLGPLAGVAKAAGAWYHVDGAYGWAYSLVPGWEALFAGAEQADSVSWDPHKQFRVAIPSSLLFVQRGDEFRRMALFADYFNREQDPEPNPGLKSMPSTRPFAALPLVTAIRYQGLGGVRQALRSPLVAIRAAADYIQRQPDLELAHQPDTAILCFRATPSGVPEERLDALQEAIYRRIMRGGTRTIAMTRLDGKIVLRLVAISPAVSEQALLETVTVVQHIAAENALG
jgi:glutamate/tyrosine decarboxylase-like PLP-dependent enzyme